MPLSYFFTFLTCVAWSSIELSYELHQHLHFCHSNSHADSVTVSIAAEITGKFKEIILVNRVLREASFGVKSEYLGNNNTSSYINFRFDLFHKLYL